MTEGLEEVDLLLLICSLVLVFSYRLVCPTYEALQSLHKIL